MRVVRFGSWLYVRTYHDGYHLFPPEMLYDVERDPHETHDVAAARPEVAGDAARKYLDWHDAMMAGMDCPVDPLWTVMREGGPFHARGALRRYAEHLKTGRTWAVDELRKRHPREHA